MIICAWSLGKSESMKLRMMIWGWILLVCVGGTGIPSGFLAAWPEHAELDQPGRPASTFNLVPPSYFPQSHPPIVKLLRGGWFAPGNGAPEKPLVEGEGAIANSEGRGVGTVPGGGSDSNGRTTTERKKHRQEDHFLSEEEKLRHTLLSVDGPDRILRESERIPALLLLSDNALRITYATPADGRLAALAIYRLGAAARASETGTAVRVDATPGSNSGVSGSAAPSTGSENTGNDVTTTEKGFQRTVEGRDTEVGDPATVLQNPLENHQEGGHKVDGEGQTKGKMMGQGQSSNGGGQVMDLDAVTGDQRFDQLVECVVCTAEELSMSDISKVVWGLSILGRREDSLVEALARILTARLRDSAVLTAVDQAYDSGYGPALEPPEQKNREFPSSAINQETSGAADALLDDAPGAEAGRVVEEDRDVVGTPTGEHATSAGGEGLGESLVSKALGGDSRPVVSNTPTASGREHGELLESQEAMHGEAEVDGSRDVRVGGEEEEVPADSSVLLPGSAATGSDLATAALAFAYAHARLGLSSPELLEAIAANVKPQINSLTVRDVANLAWAFAVHRQLDSELMEGIAVKVCALGPGDNLAAKDVSILAWAYGTLEVRPPRLLWKLVREGLNTVEEALPHDLSNLAWGIARVGLDVVRAGGCGGMGDDGAGGERWAVQSSNCIAAHVSGTEAHIAAPEAPPSPTSQTWQSSKDDFAGERTFSSEGNAVAGMDHMGGFVMQEVAEDGQCQGRGGGEGEQDESLGELGSRDMEQVVEIEDMESPLELRFGEVLLARAEEGFRQFRPKQLARLCWALASWKLEGLHLLGAGGFVARVLQEVGQRPEEYVVEELAQVLWSFAVLVGNDDSPGQELAGVVGSLSSRFVSSVSGMEPSMACDVLWAVATMGHPAHELCEEVGRVLLDRVQDLTPPSLAALTWAQAKMGHHSAELMERLLSVVELRLGEFSAADAASSLWAFGALGYAVTLKRPFSVEKKDLRSLNPSASANLLWGLAKTGVASSPGFDRDLLDAVAADMESKLLSFSPKELCRSAWAIACLGYHGPPSFASAGNGEGDDQHDVLYSSEGVTPGGGEGRGGVMERLLTECSKWMELFTPQELEELLWSICRLEERADALVANMEVEVKARQKRLPTLLLDRGPSAARDAAFRLGSCRHWLSVYRALDFDGHRARGRYSMGKSMLSRMFGEG